MTEIISYFSHFVKKVGAPNFLAIGVVIIVIWLLISGFKKGLKRKGGNKDSEGEDQGV